MNKNKLGKIVLATAVASSVVAVANPADAATVTKAEKAVQKAEKLAAQLKKESSIEYRKKHSPKKVYSYNYKLHSDTKKALAAAKKEVSKLKSSSKKKALEAKLKTKVEAQVKYSTAYIYAIKRGNKLAAVKQKLNKQYINGVVDSTTVKLHKDLQSQLKISEKRISNVYGKSTRSELRKYYNASAETLVGKLNSPVAIKAEIDKASKAIKDKKIDSAATYLGNVDYLVKVAEKNGQKKTYKIMKGALKDLKSTQTSFNKYATLYVASSTKSSSPTTFTSSKTLTKDVYIIAGKGEYAKLKNTVVKGNVIVKGNKGGAGTVTLEGVTVEKSGDAKGQIIVEDVANHSLYLTNTVADSIVVNDANGANLVANDGVKVKNLVVSEKAGSKGTITLESKSAGSFETITVAAKGSKSSEGVALKGELGETVITVTGENSKISVAKGATVKEILILAPTNISVADGSVVKEMKKDPSIKGEVKVDNKGTIEKAEEGINIGGKKPVEVTPPTTTPGGGSGGGGGGAITPAIIVSQVNALFSNPARINASLISSSVPNNYELRLNQSVLTSVADSAKFRGVTVETNLTDASSTQLHLKSLKIKRFSSTYNWVTSPITYNVNNGTTFTIYTQDLFKLTGSDGISISNLRALAGNQDIIISGEIDNGTARSDVSITINLGSGEAANSYQNEYVKITKDQAHSNKAVVSINPTHASKSVRVVSQELEINLAKLIASFIINEPGSEDFIEGLEEAIKDLTLDDLRRLGGNGTYINNGLTVEFNNLYNN